jgi:16S rRNA (cytidine1402-2'-O)-methyltransferase
VTTTRIGTLYLVATPIGNLEDITLRALRILREVALIAAEDTRRTRKLLAAHRIPARVVSLHEHNERTRAPELVARLVAGESVALVSDAGTPGLSDPGVDLVRHAADAGVPVIALPGPSAFITALVASGLPTAPVTFLGFLPASPPERQRVLEAFRTLTHTTVIYEAPHRLIKTLAALKDAWGDRHMAIARELTKIHEEVFRGTIREAIQRFTDHPPRGEFTLVVAGAAAGRTAGVSAAGASAVGASECAAAESVTPQAGEAARAMLRRALKEGVAPFEAVRRAAQATGLRRNAVYRIWLALKQGGGAVMGEPGSAP